MTAPGQDSFYPRRHLAFVVAGLAAALVATGFATMAQDRNAAAAKDVILARKTLMNAIGDEMDRISNMISQRQFDLHDAHKHADNISVMLMTFPHLFPPSSNQWRENADRDPATDTIASPDIWTDFADFYRRAAAAAKTADEIRRAPDEDEVKRLHRALWIACDTCHSLYLKE